MILLGQRHVSEYLHTFSVAMVALGQTVVVFWVVALMFWLDILHGAHLLEGRFQVFDWQAVLLNFALSWRMYELLVGAGLAAASLVAGATATLALRRCLKDSGRLAFHSSIVIAVLMGIVQIPITVGDLEVMQQYQPAKARLCWQVIGMAVNLLI